MKIECGQGCMSKLEKLLTSKKVRITYLEGGLPGKIETDDTNKLSEFLEELKTQEQYHLRITAVMLGTVEKEFSLECEKDSNKTLICIYAEEEIESYVKNYLSTYSGHAARQSLIS